MSNLVVKIETNQSQQQQSKYLSPKKSGENMELFPIH